MERIDRGQGVAVLVDARSLEGGRVVLRAVRQRLPAADVRPVRGPHDVAGQLHAVLVHRPRLVIGVGPDRTAVRLVNALQEASRLLASLSRPLVGLVGPAGSGWVRSFGGGDLEAFLSRLPELGFGLPSRIAHLLEAEGRLGPLAGAGLDATSVRGRLASGRDRVEVEVIDLSGDAALVGRAGPVAAPGGPGRVLYRGPFLGGEAASVSASGAPDAEGRMQLRIWDRPVLAAVRDLPLVLRGLPVVPTWRSFLARRVRLAFSRPVPVRFGGESAGEREEVELGVGGGVPLVDWAATFPLAA